MDFGPTWTKIEVPALNEWRVETSKNSILSLKLESGTAEIFGTELSKNLTYVFKESLKFAVSTYHGCTLSYTASTPLDLEYISEETMLKQLLNLHLSIENLSVKGTQTRMLIMGPKDVGKSTISRTLAAYTLKTSEKSPILVNIDPRLPHFAISTQLTAAKLYDLLDVETSTIGESSTTGPGTGIYKPQIPLVKSFGLENYNENLELYKCLISELSYEVDSKIKASSNDAGTIIIDTPPFNISDWKLVQHIVDSFKINTLLVVGNERLLVDLRKKLNSSGTLNMIKLARSSGCVDKEPKFERELQQRSIKQYFYGVERAQLNPYTFHCSVKDFIFLRPKEQETDMTFLDFMNGDADDDDNYNITAIKEEGSDDDYDPFSQTTSKKVVRAKQNWKYQNMLTLLDDPKETDLTYAVLSIIDSKDINIVKLMSSKIDAKEKLSELAKHITTKSVVGFSYVSGFDEKTGKLKLLIPSPVTSLPGSIMVITQMRYQE
ncbi:Cleavage polyadenylation factor subunit clp1 [Pichia californica]|uniref:Polynucleotide 5'-hydroxyl-kinase GRC3 n=1 Tax=Pichia californica TaxID=460514 RepID=A0A9P6WGZ2_9ASCO|nr:Cleavage polyadenylation factor subunit clp1 [[Candida] californica]KAG0687009.1 Cleavage polyadenylation factor subunit clp1 [[Candida] californica]